MSKEEPSPAKGYQESLSPSHELEAAPVPALPAVSKPSPTTGSKLKSSKTKNTPQVSEARPLRKTPTTVGPNPPSIYNTRATARKAESTTRTNSSDQLVFSLSRDASQMSAEEIVREVGGQITLADSPENVFDGKGGSTSLFDASQKRRNKRSRGKEGDAEASSEAKSKKKKKKRSNKWLDKKPGETPEKLYTSSPSNWEHTIGETPTKSTVRGDEAKWMMDASRSADSPPPEVFKREQGGTPTKAPKLKNKTETKAPSKVLLPLPDGWWNVMKLTDDQRDLYVQLFEDSAKMKRDSQYQLWNTALEIMYLVGEEQGAWGSDPQWEKKLSGWRTEMIFKHDLTIPPPISWNREQSIATPRPTDEERRAYTENFHKMYNNAYWRISNQTWQNGSLDRCHEANKVILGLRAKYMDFPWCCLPLPSHKWQNHPNQYIPRPAKQYCEWAVRMVDFGLMNFGDAEDVRVPGYQPMQREGSFEYYFHKAWLETTGGAPKGTINLAGPESDNDGLYILDTSTQSPEPAPEIEDAFYYDEKSPEEDELQEEEEDEDGEESIGDKEVEDATEKRQMGMKSKVPHEYLTSSKR